MPPKTRTVETVKAPPPVDLSYIPTDVTAYFGGLGMVCSLASRYDQVIAQASINSRYPVLFEDIAEEHRADFKSQLTRHGFRIDSVTGMVHKGDCALYAQPADARDAQLREGTEIWLQRDEADLEADARQMAAEAGLLNGMGHLVPHRGGIFADRLSDHSVSVRPQPGG